MCSGFLICNNKFITTTDFGKIRRALFATIYGKGGALSLETVYVDILILTNFIADYFLLLLTAFMSSVEVKRWRLLLGAGAAALSSLLIFAPEMSLALEIPVKLAVSLVIVFVAFGFANLKRYIKATLVFYAANAILAGGAMLVWSVFAPRGLVVRNGAVFYNISPVVLIVTCAAVYVISLVVSKMISRRRSRGREYSVVLEFEGKKAEVKGIVDSGNMLRDAISGSPVIVCDFDKVSCLLDSELKEIMKKQNFELGFYSAITTSRYKNRFRVIPFESVGGSGVMAALVMDRAVITSAGEKREIPDIIVAVTHKKIAGGEFDVLLNPELILV